MGLFSGLPGGNILAGIQMPGVATGNSEGGNFGSGILDNITAPFTEPSRLRDAGNNSAKPENQVYDPFGGQRAQYQGQLSALMADPSSIQNMPGYNAGMQAIMRKLASQGYLGSGKMMESLMQYGGAFYSDAIKNLTQLAGGNLTPTRTDSSGMLKGEEDAAGVYRHNQDIFNSWSQMGMGSMMGGGMGG